MSKLIGIQRDNITDIKTIIKSGGRGPQGLSAYEVWLQEGNQGTVEDFFESLKGEVSRTEFEEIKQDIEQTMAGAMNEVDTTIAKAENKIVDVENRFQTLTTEQQQDAEVIDARQGKTSLVANIQDIKDDLRSHKEDYTSLNIGNRLNSLEEAKVKRYGVTFSGSSTKGTRVEDAVGMIAQVAVDDEIVVNDFDKVSFFNRPICCGYHDVEGRFHVNAYRGEPGFTWDGSNGEVYYECTPFYYKGDLHTYISVSATPLEGYKLAPMFKNGHDKVYCPVFPIAMVDGVATSRAGVFPTSGSMNTHMANARTYHEKAHTETMAVRISEYMLMLVEFATKDLQTVMQGATAMAYSNDDKAVIGETLVNRIILPKERAERFVIGQTIGIGPNYYTDSVAADRIVTDIVPYDEENTAIYFDGDPVDITEGDIVASRYWINGAAATVVTASSGSIKSNTDAKYPCIWRGRENPWGSAYSAICDILIDAVEAGDSFENTLHYLEDPTKYDNGNITDDYIELNYKLADTGGYIKTLGQDKRYPHVRLPDEVGGSSNTYLADYYYAPTSAGVRVVFAGGHVNGGRRVGPLCFHCGYSPSASTWNRLSRLFVTP